MRMINQTIPSKDKLVPLRAVSSSLIDIDFLKKSMCRIYDEDFEESFILIKPDSVIPREFFSIGKGTTSMKDKKMKSISRATLKDLDYKKCGKNLLDIKKEKGIFVKEGYDDLLPLPELERFLHLIPNRDEGNQCYVIYRNVVMAIANEGGSKKLAIEWAAIHTEKGYDDSVMNDFDRHPRRGNECDSGEGLHYLKRLAKLARPDFFRCTEVVLEPFFKLDTGDIPIIEQTSQYINGDDVASAPQKVIILSAMMGRGKTTAIQKLTCSKEFEEYTRRRDIYNAERGAQMDLRNKQEKRRREQKFLRKKGQSIIGEMEIDKPDVNVCPIWDDSNAPANVSVLCVTSRISFSLFMANELSLDYYVDKKNEIKRAQERGEETDGMIADRLVSSVESLLQINKEVKYDYIILDEIESILSQFLSPTVRRKEKIWEYLLSSCMSAKKVILADAFISNKTICYAREICRLSRMNLCDGCVMFKSIWNPPERIAYQLPTKGTYLSLPAVSSEKHNISSTGTTKNDSIDPFLEVMDTFLGEGKKVYGCFCSAQDLKDHTKYFLDRGLLSGDDEELSKHYHAIHRLGDDEDFLTVRDMEKSWSHVSAVFVSPIITIGCSFNPKDENGIDKPIFYSTMMKLKATCLVRDIIQSHFRVRNTISNTIYFQLPSKQSLSMSQRPYKKFESVLDDIQYHFDTRVKKDKIDTIDIFLKKVETMIDEMEETHPDLAHLKRSSVQLNNLKKMIFMKDDEVSQSYKLNYALCLGEQIASSLYYDEFVMRYLKLCGYTVKAYEGERKPMSKPLSKLNSSQTSEVAFHKRYNPFPYQDIRELYFREEYMMLVYKKSRMTATRTEKAQVERYLFDEFINLQLPEDRRKDLFEKYWYGQTDCEANFKPLVVHHIELEQMKDQAIITRLGSMEYGCDKNDFKRVLFIRQLNELLGLSCSTSCGVIITRDVIEDSVEGKHLFDFLKDNFYDLRSHFGARVKMIEEQKVKPILGFINTIYGNWSGLEFVADGKKNTSNKQYSQWKSKSLLGYDIFKPKRKKLSYDEKHVEPPLEMKPIYVILLSVIKPKTIPVRLKERAFEKDEYHDEEGNIVKERSRSKVVQDKLEFRVTDSSLVEGIEQHVVKVCYSMTHGRIPLEVDQYNDVWLNDEPIGRVDKSQKTVDLIDEACLTKLQACPQAPYIIQEYVEEREEDQEEDQEEEEEDDIKEEGIQSVIVTDDDKRTYFIKFPYDTRNVCYADRLLTERLKVLCLCPDSDYNICKELGLYYLRPSDGKTIIFSRP